MSTSPAAQNLRRNAAWMLFSRILRTSLAAVYFALLARSLGVSGYGAFMGVCALASVLSPFAGVGSGNLLIRDVARDRAVFSKRWGTCLVATLVSGSLLVTASAALSTLLLPRSLPLLLVLTIGVAELLFARLLDLAGMAFQAVEQLSMTAWFSFALTLARCLAAGCLLLLVPHATPLTWAWLYLISTALPACLAVATVHQRLGLPVFRRFGRKAELREGLFFSISLSAQTIYNDIDKTMLARMASLASTGLYAAAYRIVDAAFSPVNAVMYAAYAKFFQHGAHGLRDASRFGLRMLARAAAYSLALTATLWLTAPYIPKVLGSQFAESVAALRLLSPLLLLRSIHVWGADSLTGAGYQGTRTVLQVFVAFGNIALNIALLPRYSWRGACYSTLICDGMLVVLLWGAVFFLRAREARLQKIIPEYAAAEF